ncbi:recombinase RecT [Neobacillus sp. MM2021_6]|uniref:recombinase RecT n=1 Tax=Bacillaceae TaxID=186817 RepID=UPI00140A0F37|nr:MULTISPECIES: recombinase RecT [Bacillaceae]MBO0959532.1 recombinase RecT [Neobacillus sp. MM2021_6]NHC17170.1 recombinase [Bacillus sp. MM2020_4]
MSNQLALIKKDTVDVVAMKVKEFQEKNELHFPANYSPENAMKSAWLLLQTIKTGKQDGYRPALEVCTKDSIANSLLDMVVQGLNPAKKQGYFIVYGKQLTFQRSYFGTMAVTKRVTSAKDIDAAVIYEGDEVDYEMVNGRITNLTHKQKFGNINKEKILGAYATIVMADGTVYHELMTIDEIRKAWSKAQFWSKGSDTEQKGTTHDEFRGEMAKKTVINRACKKFMNSSDDSSLVMQHINRAEDAAEEAQLEEEIKNNANGEIIDVEFEERPDQQEQIQEPESQNEAVAADGLEF